MSWDDQRDGRRGIEPLRRDVMKAVGIGGAIGVLGGTAAASEHQSGDAQSGNGDDQAAASDGASVHTVRTLSGPSTSPDRPADFYFEPTGLHVEPGDVVEFVFETPDHNVTSYHPAYGMQRRIPAGVRPFSSPIMGWRPESLPADVSEPPTPGSGGDESGDGAAADDTSDGDAGDGPEPSTWLYAFEEPGVYDLECAPHEHFGMAMRIVVGTRRGRTSRPRIPPPSPSPGPDRSVSPERY